MSTAALVIACAAICVNGYQLYWLRRLRDSVRETNRIRAERMRVP